MDQLFFYDKKAEYADHTMFVLPDGRTYTYGEVWNLEDRILADVPTGSLVFLLCRNEVLPISFYLGCLRAGCVPLLLSENITAGRLSVLIDTYHPGFVLLPADRIPVLSESQALIKSLETATISTENIRYFSEACEPSDLPSEWALWSSGLPAPELHPDLALLLSTSGSTGSSKLVRISRRNLQCNAESIVSYLQITAGDRAITSLPMEYTYGLSVINTHVLKGAALLLTDLGLLDLDFWEFFRSAQATSFAGVPYSYALLDRLGILDMDLPSLTVLTQAGGKLPAALQERIAGKAAQKGIRFYIMYGQTEATARMSYLPPQDCPTHPGSIGIAIPGGRFAILTEDGTETAEPGAEGELIYYGPNVSMGYAQTASDLALGDISRGRLCTGDLARADADGFYSITGRMARFVKISGRRTNLDELEALLKGCDPDSTWLCTGDDDTVIACRICTIDDPERKKAECKNIRSFLSKQAHLPLSCIRVVFLPEVPRTASGKISYQSLWEAESN